MVRRSKRQDADELRAKFVANREKVRSFIANWRCPEIEWPAFREIPLPWVIPNGEEEQWLQQHAPFMDEYRWLLEPRPVTEGVSQVWACWWFGKGHEFELLEIDFRSYADPQYLAETLTWGAHAAALKGWREEDVHALYDWLFEGIDSRPMEEGVRGQKRTGFILFKLVRMPVSRTEIGTRLSMTLTDKALDGTPLTADGRTASG
jgi:hypothetical protein